MWFQSYGKFYNGTYAEQHDDCPTGEDSWCWWQAWESYADGMNDDLTHDEPLHPLVAQHILPIYEDLSRDDLLERCLGGHTQNNNECLNALIWKFAPKHLFSGKETVEIATYLAISIFNEGFTSILRVMTELGITIGRQSYDYTEFVGKRRKKKADKDAAKATKEARRARKQQLAEQEDMQEDADDLVYGAGIAD